MFPALERYCDGAQVSAAKANVIVAQFISDFGNRDTGFECTVRCADEEGCGKILSLI